MDILRQAKLEQEQAHHRMAEGGNSIENEKSLLEQ
jgi:hypothetical protein